MTDARRKYACLAAFALVGCGDHLVAAEFQGEPVYTHPSFGVALQGAPPEITRPHWGVFWFPQGVADTELVEQPGTARAAVDTRSVLHLLADPPAELLARTESGARYGVMVLRLYEDVDGDGAHSAGDRYLGASGNGVIYFPSAVDASDSPIGRAFSAGYHRIDFPLPCAPAGQDLPACEAAEIRVGDRCQNPEACPHGPCLSGLLGWPGGYCAGAGTTCRPPGAVLWENPKNSGEVDRYWLAACQSDDDCRASEGYYCNPAVRGCMPAPEMLVSYDRGPPREVCLTYLERPEVGGPGPAPDPDPQGECAVDADCEGRCDPNAVDCGCDVRPDGAECIARCAVDADCPKDDEVCDAAARFCRRAR